MSFTETGPKGVESVAEIDVRPRRSPFTRPSGVIFATEVSLDANRSVRAASFTVRPSPRVPISLIDCVDPTVTFTCRGPSSATIESGGTSRAQPASTNETTPMITCGERIYIL